MITSILLTVLSLSAPATEEVEVEVVIEGLPDEAVPLIVPAPPINGIPQAPLVRKDLPPPTQIEGLMGTFLPAPLDQALADYIGYCSGEMPRLCQKAVDNVKGQNPDRFWFGVGIGVGSGIIVSISVVLTKVLVTGGA